MQQREAKYYQQEVNATIISHSTEFEHAMVHGQPTHRNRSDYPMRNWPDHKFRLRGMNLTAHSTSGIEAVAIAAYQRPPEEYLDPILLQNSAYRLLFASQMLDILGTNLDSSTANPGERRYITEAVTIVPAFAYAIEGLLGTAILLTTVILYSSAARPRKLASNPGSIGSMMSLVADNLPLLKGFKPFDKVTHQELEDAPQGSSYFLTPGGKQYDGYQLHSGGVSSRRSSQHNHSFKIVRAVRPIIFRVVEDANSIESENSSNSTWRYRAITRGFEAQLSCVHMASEGHDSINVSTGTDGHANLTYNLGGGDEGPPCSGSAITNFMPDYASGLVASEANFLSSSDLRSSCNWYVF
ncbi:MAG: hypothetical protein M1816_006824 [Peltula sp. TS41687]|nr:MAG: hypothetical protein M1816_006824 [Peltula sp. TS41687]